MQLSSYLSDRNMMRKGREASYSNYVLFTIYTTNVKAGIVLFCIRNYSLHIWGSFVTMFGCSSLRDDWISMKSTIVMKSVDLPQIQIWKSANFIKIHGFYWNMQISREFHQPEIRQFQAYHHKSKGRIHLWGVRCRNFEEQVLKGVVCVLWLSQLGFQTDWLRTVGDRRRIFYVPVRSSEQVICVLPVEAILTKSMEKANEEA